MKVTRSTNTQLIVEDRPLLVTLALGFFFMTTATVMIAVFATGEILLGFFLMAFTAFIGIFIAVFVRRVQVIFDRTAGTITFRSRSLWGYREVVHDLANLSHAKTEGYDTMRSVLVLTSGMSAGDHPVTTYSTSGPGPKRLTKAINDWLEQTAPVDSSPPGA